MSGRADPRRAMHVQPDIVVVADVRLTSVDADPHAHLDALGPAMRHEGPLRAHRGGDRVARPREGDEEPVALGVDLTPAVLVEHRAQQPLMLGEHHRVIVAQPCQQPRRPLDVAEQKRDGATRKVRDTTQLSPQRVKSRPLHGLPPPPRGHPGPLRLFDDTGSLGRGSTRGSLLPQRTRRK